MANREPQPTACRAHVAETSIEGILPPMTTTHLCARCEHEFVADSARQEPACPRCGRTDTVDPVESSELVRDIARQWLVVFALLFVLSLVYIVFELTKS